MVDSSFLQHDVGVLLLAGLADHPAVHALREGAPAKMVAKMYSGERSLKVVEKMGC